MIRKRWIGGERVPMKDDVLEAKDQCGNWLEAVVLSTGDEEIFVHFVGFDSRFDERVSSENVRPLSDEWRSNLCVGNKVEALIDVTNGNSTKKRKRLWHLGIVVEEDEDNNICVEYADTGTKRWYGKESESIARVQTHVKTSMCKTFQKRQCLARFSRPCGLVNLGNTCYVNSPLQILMHCNPVLLDEILRSSSNRNVLKSLTKLFNSAKIITNKSRGRSSLSPESVKEAMDCRFSQFRGHEQQDAHEFLQCILNSLHIDFRSGEREKTSIIEEDNGFVVSPLQFWISHTTSNRSVVQDQFEGLTTSLTTCPDCSFTRRTNEPFMILTLPIPDKKKNKDLTLEDCLENLLGDDDTLNESNSWHCEHCDKDVLAKRSTSIWYLPDTIVMCLKRFRGGGKKDDMKDDDKDDDAPYSKKITTSIEYPIQGLDMSRFWRCDCCTKEKRCERVRCANAERKTTTSSPIFDLCAVIEHKGKSVEFGHYTSSVICGDAWYQCNDDRIRRLKAIESSRNAYVLVYRRV